MGAFVEKIHFHRHDHVARCGRAHRHLRGRRDAFRSTDRFFDAQGLHDVQVLSTAGLSNGDIAALRKVNGVAKVQAERSQEVTFDLDGRKSATMQEIGTNGIDQPYLQEGRMPKKAGEIAVTRKFIRDSGKRIAAASP